MTVHPAITRIATAQAIIDDLATGLLANDSLTAPHASDQINLAYSLLTEAMALLETDPRLQ